MRLRRAQLATAARFVYGGLAVATTITGVRGAHREQLWVKAPLVPTLGLAILDRWPTMPVSRRLPLGVALASATAGDLFMWRAEGASAGGSPNDRTDLHRGASAFAVQQLGYLVLLRERGARPGTAEWAAVGAVLAGLAITDTGTGGAPDPVLTGYGLLLGAMAAYAIALRDAGDSGRRIAAGGALFLASDAMILLRDRMIRTVHGKAAAEAFVLATYCLAQRLLVRNVAQ